ncbi:lipopolysaccharide biosynthesis protein [Clostridium autoethanogenum]|nr:oligosaccharide flippase family protein [Clostridium autoethanogenum]
MIRKLKNKYMGLSEPVKASLWFAICNILQKGIALLSTPIFTRLLSTNEYGGYAVFQSWNGIFTILATLNLFLGGFGKGLIEFEKDKRRLTSSLLQLSTLITTVVFLVYLCDIRFWTSILNMSSTLMIALFLELYTLPAFEFWSTEQRYEFKYRKLVALSLLMSIGSIILGIITVLLSTQRLEARVYSDAICKAAVGIVLYCRIIKLGNHRVDTRYWKYGILFNLPLIPHYLSTMILNQSDRILIDNIVSSSAAGMYSIAYTIGMMMQLITNAVNNSFTPYTFMAIRDETYEKIRKNANFLCIFVALLMIVSMAFAPEIILIFAGKRYYDAIWVLPPVAASVFFIFLYSLFSNVEYYFKKTKFIAVASMLCAVVNLLLNYILIPIYGYYAAGYTTLVCYILYAFTHFVFMRKVCIDERIHLESIYNVKNILLYSVAVLVIMLIMIFTYEYFVVRYLIILVIGIIGYLKRKKIIDIMKQLKI